MSQPRDPRQPLNEASLSSTLRSPTRYPVKPLMPLLFASLSLIVTPESCDNPSPKPLFQMNRLPITSTSLELLMLTADACKGLEECRNVMSITETFSLRSMASNVGRTATSTALNAISDSDGMLMKSSSVSSDTKKLFSVSFMSSRDRTCSSGTPFTKTISRLAIRGLASMYPLACSGQSSGGSVGPQSCIHKCL